MGRYLKSSIKYSVLEMCEDFKILKENLTEDELEYVNNWCEIHENSLPDENGKYPCGCVYNEEEDTGEHCNAGLWLNGNIKTEEFIELFEND